MTTPTREQDVQTVRAFVSDVIKRHGYDTDAEEALDRLQARELQDALQPLGAKGYVTIVEHGNAPSPCNTSPPKNNIWSSNPADHPELKMADGVVPPTGMKLAEEWVKEIEKFYPNQGDHVIEWRRNGAANIFLQCQQNAIDALRREALQDALIDADVFQRQCAYKKWLEQRTACNTSPTGMKSEQEWRNELVNAFRIDGYEGFLRVIHDIQQDAIDALRRDAVPDGYVFVPKEPTRQMLNADFQELTDLDEYVVGIIYKAMLAAAPQPAKDKP